MADELKSVQPMGKSLADRIAPAVVYRISRMDQVKVISNLQYTDVADSNLLLDAYKPPLLEPHERRPAVFLIHGGAGPASRPKDWGLFQSWGRLLAAAGMIAVVFTQRYSPAPHSLLAEAALDVRSAIDFVRANATLLQVDAERMHVIAWSSGGALLSALLKEPPMYLRSMVGLFPLLDLQQYAPPGDRSASQFLKAFSAIEALPRDASGLPPMMIVRAGRDEIPTLNDALDRFVAKALATNAPITVINHPPGEHGFDNQQDDAATRRIISNVLEFIRSQT